MYPVKIGLTGGLGCGKSLALKLFAEYGYKLINADVLVHEILRDDVSIKEILVSRWGNGILDEEGALDRKKISKIVFKKAPELEFLESVVHPRVIKKWEEIMHYKGAEKFNWIVEVPLLFEKNLEKFFNFTVCIYTSEVIQKYRLMARGLTADEAQERIEYQMPVLEKVLKADYVILNNGTELFLNQQISRLVQSIANK